MDLHLVGGFLGSGKTTAIIQAARLLMKQGKRVGVITNDQGKYLVDTAFFQLADIPTVEVTGGCFCCNFNALEDQLEILQQRTAPDVIFAEAVGSCADIVATVLKPLSYLETSITPTSFSVLVDARLFLRWLKGDALPYSENISYIFGQQLEEAGLLIINKYDLLNPQQLEETQQLAHNRFPVKQIRTQNSLDDTSISRWLNDLETLHASGNTLDTNYQQYGLGERQLAWLDTAFTIEHADRSAILALLAEIRDQIVRMDIPIGHLKFMLWDDTYQAKVSFLSLDDQEWQSQVPPFNGSALHVILNLRAETTPQILRQIAEDALNRIGGVQWESLDAFQPGWPLPVYRLTDM
ncbi:MAG: hypothetical protein K8L99_03760 [Anaerolineae bacterium]|nr:hypothetical protein [Anaerolineae bacterium]